MIDLLTVLSAATKEEKELKYGSQFITVPVEISEPATLAVYSSLRYPSQHNRIASSVSETSSQDETFWGVAPTTSLRLCTKEHNHTLHVAVRDRLGRLFSTVQGWRLGSGTSLVTDEPRSRLYFHPLVEIENEQPQNENPVVGIRYGGCCIRFYLVDTGHSDHI